MENDRLPEDFDSYAEYARAVHKALPDNWDTTIDEQSIKQEHNRIGFQRDDLYRFMLALSPNENWPAESIGLYLPDEIDQIADRPGVPVHHLEHPSIDAILVVLEHETPEYQGTFSYDE